MGQPAARLGDMTAHGGSLVMGMPTVLIGGMPAARVGDMHVCPMVTPAPAPIPHAGGPALPPGAPTVLIGGLPALRMGDMLVCVGPPDVVALGCMTVLIGTGAGSGSGSGSTTPGGGGGGSAQTGAAIALSKLNHEPRPIQHWVVFQVKDKAGKPIPNVPNTFTDADGRVEKGYSNGAGLIHRYGMKKNGQSKVEIYAVHAAKWSKQEAKVGDTLTLEAKVLGFENGTKALFQIHKRDIKRADVVIAEVETTTKGDKVSVSWKYEHPFMDPNQPVTHFSSPEFYFEVLIQNTHARSNLMRFSSFIQIALKDDTGRGIPNASYLVYVSNGEVRKGQTDGNGKAKIENLPPVPHKVVFLDYPGITKTEETR
ncbi:MAG TPA: hypothetical protein DIW24_04630 [Bacteroidetes bacterium]|nr:hypothetical protein [Bacteroidota bacterium]HRR07127.1 PAAR domain-containing protein [Rhodothermales bacterium]